MICSHLLPLSLLSCASILILLHFSRWLLLPRLMLRLLPLALPLLHGFGCSPLVLVCDSIPFFTSMLLSFDFSFLILHAFFPLIFFLHVPLHTFYSLISEMLLILYLSVLLCFIAMLVIFCCFSRHGSSWLVSYSPFSSFSFFLHHHASKSFLRIFIQESEYFELPMYSQT